MYANGSKVASRFEFAIRPKSVVEKYESYHNVTWKNRGEVNWGKRLSEIIGIDCINEAQSGGGPMRSIRMTYDFIHKNWDKKDKFFIIKNTSIYYRYLR